jgi:glycosyltransferase involved in cell wall biosynthesis
VTAAPQLGEEKRLASDGAVVFATGRGGLIVASVSVVITAYNYGHLVEQTLASVFGQTFRDLEVVFVDDASTDNTMEVLSKFRTQPLRCIVHRPWERRCQSYSRNEGIEASVGKYVAFVDADDLWLPTKLQEQVDLLDRDPSLGMVYCDVERFDHDTGMTLDRISDSTRLYTGDVLEQLVLKNFVLSPSPLWIRIAERFRIGAVHRVLARQRVHSQAVTMTEDLFEFYRISVDIVERAVARSRHRLERIRKPAISRVAYAVGKKLASRAQRVEAFRMYLRSAKADPSNLRAYGGMLVMSAQRILGERMSRVFRLGRLGKLIR